MALKVSLARAVWGCNRNLFFEIGRKRAFPGVFVISRGFFRISGGFCSWRVCGAGASGVLGRGAVWCFGSGDGLGGRFFLALGDGAGGLYLVGAGFRWRLGGLARPEVGRGAAGGVQGAAGAVGCGEVEKKGGG